MCRYIIDTYDHYQFTCFHPAEYSRVKDLIIKPSDEFNVGMQFGTGDHAVSLFIDLRQIAQYSAEGVDTNVFTFVMTMSWPRTIHLLDDALRRLALITAVTSLANGVNDIIVKMGPITTRKMDGVFVLEQ